MAAKARIDIAIVMLGINDAKGRDWEKAEYVRDYLKMVQEILRLHSNATVFVAVPPPCTACERATRHELAGAVAAVRREARLETEPLNFYDAFAVEHARTRTGTSSSGALHLEDGVHPAALGYHLMAKVAHAAVSADMMSPRSFCRRCQASAHPSQCESFCSSTAPDPGEHKEGGARALVGGLGAKSFDLMRKLLIMGFWEDPWDDPSEPR